MESHQHGTHRRMGIRVRHAGRCSSGGVFRRGQVQFHSDPPRNRDADKLDLTPTPLTPTPRRRAGDGSRIGGWTMVRRSSREAVHSPYPPGISLVFVDACAVKYSAIKHGARQILEEEPWTSFATPSPTSTTNNTRCPSFGRCHFHAKTPHVFWSPPSAIHRRHL